MKKITLKAALLAVAVTGLSACTIVPPQVAYTGPRVEIVRPQPAPYYVSPYYVVPYYRPYHEHRRYPYW